MTELDYQAIHERDENDELTLIAQIHQLRLELSYKEENIEKLLKNLDFVLCGERVDSVTKQIIASAYRRLDEGRFNALVAKHIAKIDPQRRFL